ncbi:MAG: transglutaminase-like domain-containing protein [Candidatus Gracilibacteria bacterium]
MKKIILILTLIICSVFSYNGVFALGTSSPLIKAYNKFIVKLENKVKSEDSQLIILQKVKAKIDTTLKIKNISTKSIILLKELSDLNNAQIKEIKSKIDNSYYTNILKTELEKNPISKTNILNNTSYNIDYKQIELEKKEKQKFIDFKNSFALPNFISNVLSTNRKFLYSIQDNENHLFEFLENNKIKRIIFTSYYEITEENYILFNSKNGYILIYNGKYLFIENYEIEDKIPYSESYNLFKGFITNSGTTYYKNNSNYYYYKFQNFSYIKDNYGFYIKNLDSIGLNTKDIVLYKNGNDYVFISNFTEEKLINLDIIKNIKDKDLFLSFVIDDKKSLTHETDKYFLELKSITENLTTGLTKEEKIKKIYNYILKNITYTNPIDLSKKEIFSGIDTYKNKDGVCEGYVKLMSYMLMFAGIEDVEVIRGFVLNAPDFPKVGHAWVKIGGYYYDPTFDDPIGNNKTKEFNEYVYYKLPEDLFYTNRYNVSDLPEELKTKSQVELENIVNKNLFNLVSKYKDSGYNLMKYTLMMYKNGLNYNDVINISTFKNLITTYDVNGSDMSFYKNGVKIYIRQFKYYRLEESNIKDVLSTINYDLSNKSIFKWDLGNGIYEYRLVYELGLN